MHTITMTWGGGVFHLFKFKHLMNTVLTPSCWERGSSFTRLFIQYTQIHAIRNGIWSKVLKITSTLGRCFIYLYLNIRCFVLPPSCWERGSSYTILFIQYTQIHAIIRNGIWSKVLKITWLFGGVSFFVVVYLNIQCFLLCGWMSLPDTNQTIKFTLSSL